MNLSTTYVLELGEKSSLYYQLLREEDFDFKTKDIFVDSSLEDSTVRIIVEANSILDLKIGTSAVMKSLEIISKTMQIKKK